MVVTDLKDRILNGRYQLLHSLGQGGMALVFEAYDQLLERPVAIKLLRKDYSEIPGFRDRFLQEARAAANLSHPNIVAIYDFGIDTGEIYIVMELADGKDLKTIIENNGPFSIMEGLDIGIQICSGLGYAHRAGIVHCDVKSQNILLTRDKVAKITDFGIARAMSATTMTESEDVVWGSPHYMAPELIDGAPPTPQADVYSIGAVLYEIYAGTPPFEGVSINDVLDNHKNSDVKPIRSLVPGFPEELDLIIQKVLSKEPSLRYRTANQLGNVLLTARYHLDYSINQTQPRSYSLPPPFPVPPPLSLEDTRNLIEPKNTVDWQMIGIELLCLLMVGGLIPFWLYVYYSVLPLLR